MADSEGQKQDTGASEDNNKPITIDNMERKTEVDINPADTSEEIKEPEDTKANEARVEQLLALGINCLDDEEDSKALNYLTEAIALDNSNPLLLINRAAAYARLKNYDDAMEDAETVVEMCPNWPEAYLMKGTIYLAEFRHRLAYYTLESGLLRDPGNEKLGKVFYETKTRMQKARKGTRYPKPPTHPLMDKSTHELLRVNPYTSDFMTDPVFVDTLNRARRNHDLFNEVKYSEDQRYMVASTVASTFEMNGPDTDCSDLMDESHHKEERRRFNYPYILRFEAVRKIVLPDDRKPALARPKVTRRIHLPAVKYPKGCEIDGSPLLGEMDPCQPSFSFE